MERHRRQKDKEDHRVRHLPVIFVVDPSFPRLSLVKLDVRFDHQHGNRCTQPDLEPLVGYVRAAQDGVVDAKLVQAPEGGTHDRRALHFVIGMVGRERPDGLDRRATIGICGCCVPPPAPPPVVQEAGRLHVGIAIIAHPYFSFAAGACLQLDLLLMRLRESSWPACLVERESCVILYGACKFVGSINEHGCREMDAWELAGWASSAEQRWEV